MKSRPPSEIAKAPPQVLEQAVEAQESRLTPLFRRWPSLTKDEHSALRRLWGERIRLAKLRGARQARRSG